MMWAKIKLAVLSIAATLVAASPSGLLLAVAGEAERSARVPGSASGAKETTGINASFSIPKGHPRLFFTKEEMDALKTRITRPPLVNWVKKYLAWVDKGGSGWADPKCDNYAFAYQITGNERYAQEALKRVFTEKDDVSGVRYSRLAVVYDWLYYKMSEDEKARLGEMLGALVKEGVKVSQDYHDAFLKLGARYFALWLSAAIAIAGEGINDKGAANDLAYFLKVYPPRLKGLDECNMDGASRHYSHVVRREWITPYEMMYTATGNEFFKNIRYYRQYGTYWIYRTVGGYETINNVGDGSHLTLIGMTPTFLFSHCALRGANAASQEMAIELIDKKGARPQWEDILWYPGLKRIGLCKLPLTRIFRGCGIVMMRSGWDMEKTSKDIVAAFYNGPFLRHCHLNQGHFSIFRGRTNLTPDAGFYDYCGKTHWNEIYYNTIAHNTITIKGSEGGDGRQVRGVINKGRFPHHYWALDRGDITAYETCDFYTYILGDMTKAYNLHKPRPNRIYGEKRATSATRQFIYLRDDLFIVYDRIITVRPEFEKRFLLQSFDEPVYNGKEEVVEGAKGDGISLSSDTSLITSIRDDSKLFCQIFLPEERLVRKVGGKTFWCYNDGKLYPPIQSRFRDVAQRHKEGMPLWRSEIYPLKKRALGEFLVLLEAVGKEKAKPVRCDYQARANEITLNINQQGMDFEVTLHRLEDGGHIKITKGGRTVTRKDFAHKVSVPKGNPLLIK